MNSNGDQDPVASIPAAEGWLHADPSRRFLVSHTAAFASSENRQLVEVLRELGRLLPGGPSVDWQESRRWCGDVLRGLIRHSEASRRLTAMLAGAPYFVGGDEHHILRLDAEPDRIYKFTHGDNFGCNSYVSAKDPELTGRHFHGTGNADPFFYLTRWALLNCLSGYQTRFEGFAPSQAKGQLPRICISQPELGGSNPSRADIQDTMQRYGFVKISEDAFLLPASELFLTDVAPRNIRIVEGVPVPFDSIAQFASPEVLAWVARGCGE